MLTSENSSVDSTKPAQKLVDCSYLDHQTNLISQFQQIIRDQDKKLKDQSNLNQILKETCSQLQDKCQQLTNSINEIKSNRNVAGFNQVDHESHYLAERLQYQARINELEVKNNLLEEK